MTPRTGGLVLVSAVAVALTSSFTVSAQQATGSTSQPSPLVIQVGLDLIQIDASVTDKSGRPVTGLRPEDFTLTVDGKVQPITNTAYFGPTSASSIRVVPTGESIAEESNSDCTVVFIIDDLNMSFGSMYAARQALSRFAEEMGPARPLVALRLSSDETDRYSLYRSADRFATSVRGLRYNIRSNKGISSTSAATGEPYPQSAAMNRGESLMDPASSLTPTEQARNLDQRAFSLVSTINTLRGVPGRKAVVFVSEGFWVDNRLTNQMDMGFPFSSLFEDTNIAATLRMITEVSNRASVVLYTVDPRGLTVDFPGVADRVTAEQAALLTASRRNERMGSQASLQYLADDTGGLAIANRNDLKGGFGDVLKDQGAYYLVGFEPPDNTFVRNSGRPKFHKIKLSVNRKDLRVRTRAGYYGVTDEEVTRRAPLLATPEY